MRRPSLAMTALIVSIAALVGAPTASAQRPLFTGVSGLYSFSTTAFAQVDATGASFVRIGVPWQAIAPATEPTSWVPEDPGSPDYDWGYVDVAVKNAVAAGLTPMLTIQSAPSWAEGCQAPEFPEASCDPDSTALDQFAVAAARRYSGSFHGLPRVKYWQGLNEPNLSLFFLPQYEGGRAVSADLYRRLINGFYRAIKSVNRSNLVLAAGLGPIAVPKYTIGPLQFARELLCMKGGPDPRPKPGNCGGGVRFDIFDIHPYTTGAPTHQGGHNNVELGDLPRLQKLLRAADRAGRIKGHFKHTPLWATEFAWDSKPPDPHGLPMNIEARWTDEALYQAWSAGIEHFFWYSLRDEPLGPGPSSETLQSGLYFRGRTVAADKPKKVMFAFRFPFVAYPRKKGLFVWGRTPSGRAGMVEIELQRGGHWQAVKKVRADSAGMFQITLATRYGHDKVGAARAVVGGSTSVAFSMRPVPDFDHAPFG